MYLVILVDMGEGLSLHSVMSDIGRSPPYSVFMMRLFRYSGPSRRCPRSGYS